MHRRICGKIGANEESEHVPPRDLNELGLPLFGEWFIALIIHNTLVPFG